MTFSSTWDKKYRSFWHGNHVKSHRQQWKATSSPNPEILYSVSLDPLKFKRCSKLRLGTLSSVCQMVGPTNRLGKRHPLGAVHLPCTSLSLGVCQGAISTLTKLALTMAVSTGNVLKRHKRVGLSQAYNHLHTFSHCPLTLMIGVFNCGKRYTI